ncbi:MAG: alginate export family protein [Rubripirellula sp.]
MKSLFRKRRQLAIAITSLMITGHVGLGSASAESISEQGLTPVVVQTTLLEDASEVVQHSAEIAQPAPVEAPAPEPMVIDEPYIGYQDLAPIQSSSCGTTCNCCTKEKKAAANAGLKKAYGGVFYGNNFGYLSDPCYDGPEFWSDALKNIKTPFGTWSFGGESRTRYHDERNFRGPASLTGQDDNFWLTRHRLYADWRVNDSLRFYGEMLDANSSGESIAPLPIEENDMDIQNLFVDVKLFDGDFGKLTARVGRQELIYGAQRTVSPLDWANTRRTFEGVRGLYQKGDFSLDGFWTRPVIVDPKDADQGDERQDFFGVYATQKGLPVGTLESYYLGYNNENVGAGGRTQNFTYHTVGSRVSGKTSKDWLYDVEGAMQFGDNNTVDSHAAGFFTGGLGRKIQVGKLSPTIWQWYDYASGSEDGDPSIGDGGYHHLFPLAHKYNGFLDLFGRRNLHDINTQIITPLGDKVTMILWYHYFMLDQDTTPYNVVMIPYNAGNDAGDRELGHEIDILFNINLNARNNVLLGYSHFSGGDYYDTTVLPAATAAELDGDFDADFFYFQFQSRY